MPVITINGQIGSGAHEIGAQVAQLLEIDYVDRMIIARAANRLGATVEAVAELEQRPLTRTDRIARFLQSALERSAAAGASGDPYFGPEMGTMLGREYQDISREPITRADELDDQKFIEVTTDVIKEVADSGNAVILGRASNLILKDFPQAFHVGLVASLERRLQIAQARESLSEEEAKRLIQLQEKARVDFVSRFFKTPPDNPADCHIVLNITNLTQDQAAAIIVNAVKSM
jgi:cytidylate kinase